MLLFVAMRPIVTFFPIFYIMVIIFMYMKYLPSILKNLRMERRLTQVEVEQLTGIDRTTISAYENGTREPSLKNIDILANLYKVSLDVLCGRSDRKMIDITNEDAITQQKILKIMYKKKEKYWRYMRMFRFVIDFLCQQFNNDEFDKDVLNYGLEVLLYNIFTIVILIILTIMFKNYLFGIYFIPIFCILRITLGGYHCKTVYGCTLTMITIYSLVNVISNTIWYKYIIHVISIFLILGLLFIKPCEENTLHLKKYDILYKYIFIVIFSFSLICFFESANFIPIFTALFVVELMYLANITIN